MESNMSKEEKERRNQSITEFMGYEIVNGLFGQKLINHKQIGFTPVRYHESWDWLMV